MILQDKVVLLTGALGTLGRAQARAIAEAGAKMLLLDRLPEAEGKTLARDLGGGASYVRCDLGRLDETRREAEALAAAHGAIDVLINNAALIENRPFESVRLADYEEEIRVNSSAAFALAQAVAPGMKAKGYGKIINFCSITLNGRWDGYTPYIASKGALLGLTKGLARELGPHGVRVNAISPGAVVSDAERRVFGDRLAAYESWVIENQSLKTRITPRQIAEVVLFLISPASDAIQGQNIGVDGGW